MLDPTTRPSASFTSEPLALSWNATWPMPVTASGKRIPAMTVKITIIITDGMSWRRIRRLPVRR
jgi:hypothetical protein